MICYVTKYCRLQSFRSCTVVADVATSFICLKRAAYQRLVRTNAGQQIGFTQLEFLEDLYLFQDWALGDIQRLSNKLRQVNIAADVRTYFFEREIVHFF